LFSRWAEETECNVQSMRVRRMSVAIEQKLFFFERMAALYFDIAVISQRLYSSELRHHAVLTSPGQTA
jgi:hypothetical protein